MPSNDLSLHIKQTFPAIIWIFTEDEGDGIKSRLPFKIFSILLKIWSALALDYHFGFLGPNFLQNESSLSSQILPLTRETETK